jgi:hypothetical protein
LKINIALLLLAVCLSGCDLGSLIPAGNQFGKNDQQIGPRTINHNNYYGDGAKVIHKSTPWEMYFWVAVLAAVVVFTPLGGILASKYRSWKKRAVQTSTAIEEYREKNHSDKLDMLLEEHQDETVKKHIKKTRS